MHGYLSSKGFAVSDRQLRVSLPVIAPTYHALRQQGEIERTNPHVYYASYFGHKWHIDQNEKLVMFGVTYVMSRDGYSGKILAGAVMPCKNNLTIYDKVYRDAIIQYGLCDQIRVDHGNEFYLLLYVQEQLRESRGSQDIVPYMQTPSTQNHIIERMWLELNHRVTYPLKRAILSMRERGLIDTTSEVVQFCVSTVLIRLASVGMERMIQAWNAHSIPNHGVPNLLQSHRCGTTAIHPFEVPTVDSAAVMYRQQGGRLTDPRTYGTDPLEGDEELQTQRDQLHESSVGCPISSVFNQLICGDQQPFETAITSYITITEQLQSE